MMVFLTIRKLFGKILTGVGKWPLMIGEKTGGRTGKMKYVVTKPHKKAQTIASQQVQ
jgi:hypothetical protein